MKKVLLALALMATVTLIGCKNETKEVQNSEAVAMTEYQCPMKCEGDKTYSDKDTKCPVCGMSLKAVETAHQDTDEDHENHDHE